MKAQEFVKESTSVVSISKTTDGGALEGYVVDTTAPQLKNYLQSQHADQQLSSILAKKFNRIGIIRNLYVDEDFRGQGIGNDLMDYAINQAFDNGAESILLISDTSEDNQFNLTKWYEGFGFEIVGNAAGDPIMLLDGREQLDELYFLGSQCTKDCSGHRAGYNWFKIKQRDPNSHSPSFNKGAALAKAGK
jgi:GNAT superfamily N-acetyltransferase